MAKVVSDRIWYCPLLRRNIAEGLCADIYEAQYGGLKKSAVPEVADWNEPSQICPKCDHYFEKEWPQT